MFTSAAETFLILFFCCFERNLDKQVRGAAVESFDLFNYCWSQKFYKWEYGVAPAHHLGSSITRPF